MLPSNVVAVAMGLCSAGTEISCCRKSPCRRIVNLGLVQRAAAVFTARNQHATVCKTRCRVAATLDCHRYAFSWRCCSLREFGVKRVIA